jgi:hypothetical protein
MDTVLIFNRIQKSFGRVLELLTLDEDSLEFRVTHWANRQFAIVLDDNGVDFNCVEVINAIGYENANSERIAAIVNGYGRTAAGTLVPRERIDEYNALGK